MTNYAVGIDYGGIGDAKILGDIVNNLKKCCGGSVTSLGIGPNKVQSYGLTSAAKGKTGVYITNGVGLATPNDLAQSYYHYDHVIFVWPQYINNQWMSDENILKHTVRGEHDWNRAGSWNVGGQTAAQWFGANSKVDLVAGKSAEDIAQRICSGTFVTAQGNPSSPTGGSNSSSSNTSSSTSEDSGSSSSPLLSGEMTFEELVGEICNGIDLMFLCKRSTVVVTDFESIFAEAKYLRDNHKNSVKSEQVNLWQMEEDSYELNINQHGFYNTVYVKYKNGKVKESFEDLVRVYGEVPITYTDLGVDKSTAIMKAKAYLAAHMRDLELTVNTTMLSDADIDIGDIISIENPLTLTNSIRQSQGRDAEFLFTKGVSTSWDGDEYITSDIECQFSPTSPKRAEVPTAGSYGGSNGSGGSGDSTSGSSSGGASGMTFNSCGVSSDGKTLCAIGKPSAAGESHYGYTLYRSLFVRKCPFCGSNELYWGYMWEGNFPCTKKHNNGEDGKYEGHIYCDGCDADFSCIDGKDHMNPPRARLKRADSGPVKSSDSEVGQLKSGTFSV